MKMSSIAQKLEPEKPAQKNFSSRKTYRPFATVALIGVDGSGKSSIAKALLESGLVPMKYIYMGANIDSSNIALPTSRLAHKWKVYRHKKSLMHLGKNVPSKVTLHGLEHRIDRRGMLGGFLRLLRRVSEEMYRQLVSWLYQIRGDVVLYDRHFLFDACPSPTDGVKYRFTEQVHHWFLRNLYPRPGLAILLDAPAEVLYARKKEVPVEYLERARLDLTQKSCYARKFVIVDTTKPFDEVVEVVNKLIVDYCTNSAHEVATKKNH
jgi:thymidylate kinase